MSCCVKTEKNIAKERRMEQSMVSATYVFPVDSMTSMSISVLTYVCSHPFFLFGWVSHCTILPRTIMHHNKTSSTSTNVSDVHITMPPIHTHTPNLTPIAPAVSPSTPAMMSSPTPSADPPIQSQQVKANRKYVCCTSHFFFHTCACYRLLFTF